VVEETLPGVTQPFVLGGWEVFPDQGCIKRADDKVRLQPRAMEILVYLASRRPDVVSADELIDRLWNPSVVGEENVKVAISKLRQSLGDDPKSPTYIQTVPRRGYRVIATVNASASNESRPRYVVAVRAFETNGTDPRLVTFAQSFRRELCHQISTIGITVADSSSSVDAVIQGVLGIGDSGYRLSAWVSRHSDTSTIWSKILDIPVDVDSAACVARLQYLATMMSVASGIAKSVTRSTESRPAQNQFILGVLEFFEMVQGTGGDLGASIAYLEAACRLDTGFAEPIRQLGIHYKNRLMLRLRYADVVDKAHACARKVLAIRPDETFLLGTINSVLDLDYEAAIANLEHARAQNWPLGEIESQIGLVRLTQGRLREALEHFQTAIRVGAIANRVLAHELVATVHFVDGRYEEARSVANQIIAPTEDGHPRDIRSAMIRIRANYYADDPNGANAALDAAWSVHGRNHPEIFPGVLAMLGRGQAARDILDRNEARFQRGTLPVASESFWGHFHLGEIDAAFSWLTRAIENREHWLFPMLRRSRLLNPIRDDQRFRRALRYLAEQEALGTPTRSVAYP